MKKQNIQSLRSNPGFGIVILTLIILFTCQFSISGVTPAEHFTLFVISGASDQSLKQSPINWAIGQLQDALNRKGYDTKIKHNLKGIHESGNGILITPPGSKYANTIAQSRGVEIPNTSESLALIAGKVKNESVLMVTGADLRGLVYGILELADRITYSENPIAMLEGIDVSIEQAENSIRSITRLFVSEIEDKSWFYDKEFWESYLSMLITQRFNRFSLTLGLGYDAPYKVLDSYFIFAYPFLVSVPGYSVKVKGLPEGERERNLEMLQFISQEAAKRGLHFQLGLWGHAYECRDSPDVNYTIEGLTQKNHAEYCRNAVRTLLQACPDIDGITFRAHYESGIPDGSKSFWESVFQGVAECGRQVEIDLHSKGISYNQIGMALNTGQPVRVSTKLTAEHMGLPAHQGAMRERERSPSPESRNPRNSTARYGYSDYLSYDRDYGVYHRIWPGKQKILLWGDPALASGYGRFAGFCNTLGMEVSEPLSFKGRQGSGISPERKIYADESLMPEGGSWQKYLFSYRIWGRHLYNPDTNPDSYRRYLRYEFGTAVMNVEKALANASRILPLITSSHLPAGSAMTYWPEMYTNMPVTTDEIQHPYGDTPQPKVFGRVSPLDPAMFSPTNEFAEDFINSRPSARYSSIDVAQWLENFALISSEQLHEAKSKIADETDPAFKRLFVDVSVQNQLGLFFANKLRASVAFSLYEEDGNRDYLSNAIYFYRAARKSWEGIIEITRGVYIEELNFGHSPHIRGHWKDRLPAIDEDLNNMEQIFQDRFGNSVSFGEKLSSSAENWLKSRPALPACNHTIPEMYEQGKPLELVFKSQSSRIKKVKIHYRHVNQVEAYNIEPMKGKNGTWRFTIPGDFMNSNYPLMYFFELLDGTGNAWLYPGFVENLANQPYFQLWRQE